MKDKNPNNEAQREEKLVGLLLGELSADEKRKIEALCEKDPDWAKRLTELQTLFELMPLALDEEREFAAGESKDEWRMAPNRRGLLTGILGRKPASRTNTLTVWLHRSALIGAAAAVLVLFGGLGLLGLEVLTPSSKQERHFGIAPLSQPEDRREAPAAMEELSAERFRSYDDDVSGGFTYRPDEGRPEAVGDVGVRMYERSERHRSDSMSDQETPEPAEPIKNGFDFDGVTSDGSQLAQRRQIEGKAFGGVAGGGGGGQAPADPFMAAPESESESLALQADSRVADDPFAAPPAAADYADSFAPPPAPPAPVQSPAPPSAAAMTRQPAPDSGAIAGEALAVSPPPQALVVEAAEPAAEFDGETRYGAEITSGRRSGDAPVGGLELDALLHSQAFSESGEMAELAEARGDRDEAMRQLEETWEQGVGADDAQVERERQQLRERARFEQLASREPVSTFSLDVGDVSFHLARQALENNERPDPARIRTEDFLNAFDYGDPSPRGSSPVAVVTEQAAHPFQQERNLLRVSLRTAATGRAPQKPLNLTMVLDNSGSMERADRKEIVEGMMTELSALLHEQDSISLISFSRRPRLVLQQMRGDRANALAEIVGQIPVEGGTNIEEGLRLGNQVAVDQFDPDAGNRIVMITDGAANLGEDDPDVLAEKVRNLRQQGIGLDIFGVGADGLNDELLHRLAQIGDGRYRMLNDPGVDGGNFARALAGAFHPMARDVKIQVEFNPRRVGNFRLLGYEQSRLREEDFRDDTVQAGQLAADENGVALYSVEVMPNGSGEIGTVRVRFEDAADGQIKEMSWAIPYQPRVPELEDAQPGIRLAAAAAFLAESLQESPWGELVDHDRLRQLAATLPDEFPGSEQVGQLQQMINVISAGAP